MSENNYISQQELLDYLAGRLDKDAASRIDKIAADDPFVADAIEGLKMFKDETALKSLLEDLNSTITSASSAVEDKEETKVIAFPTWAKGLATAAVVLIVFMVGYNSIIDSRTGEKIFTENFEPYEEEELEGGKVGELEGGKVEELEGNKVGELESGEVPVSTNAIPPVVEIEEDAEEQMDQMVADEEIEEPEEVFYADEDVLQPAIEEVEIEATPEVSEGNTSNDAGSARGSRQNASESIVYADEMKSTVQIDKGSAEKKVITANDISKVPTRQIDDIAATSINKNTEVQEITVYKAKDKKGKSRKGKTGSSIHKEERSPESLAGSTISKADAEVVGILMEARGHYLEKNYELAVIRYDDVLSKDPSNDEANFYKAVSIMSMSSSVEKDFKDAINHLDKIVTDPESKFYESGLWYRALALIKLDRKKPAIKHLDKIIELNGDYKDRAVNTKKELLD